MAAKQNSQPIKTVADLQPADAKKASLDAAPAAGQLVDHEGEVYTTIQEGLAYILIPPNTPVLTDPKTAKDGTIQAQSVFYNPIQQYNRDLTVLAIRAFGEEFVAEKEQAQAKKQSRKQAARGKQNGKKAAGTKENASVADAAPAPTGLKRKAEELGSQPTQEEKEQLEAKRQKRVSMLAGAEDIADEDMLACETPEVPPQDAATEKQPAEKQNGAEQISEQAGNRKPPPRVRFEILDALSATGLRALRYAQELPFVTSITANDLSRSAVASIKLNVEHNKLSRIIKTNVGNANAHMYQSIGQEDKGGPGHQYAVIDLDPYGTAVTFLDAAVQALTNGGLLCVTCTDTGVFNSPGFLEKAFALYGGVPIKGEHCHEGGLRLILHAINTAAAKYGLAIEPLLSLSIDYYARVFVRVKKSPADVKFLASKTMVVYSCSAGCGAWQTQPLARVQEHEGKGKNADIFFKHTFTQGPTSAQLCDHCGFKTHVHGPMYGGPIHNPAFVERILSFLPDLDRKVYGTLERVEGMLSTVLEECELYARPSEKEIERQQKQKQKGGIDDQLAIARMDPKLIDHHPFYIFPSSLTRIMHCQAPSLAQLRGALRYMGYRAARSHTKPGSIKTDAPWSAIWKIILYWIRDHSTGYNMDKIKEGMPGFKILKGMDTLDEQPSLLAEAEEEEHDDTADPTISDAPQSKDSTQVRARPKLVFDAKLGADSRAKKLVRWQQNPRANWGPMARAK